jgi:hypothetical protein
VSIVMDGGSQRSGSYGADNAFAPHLPYAPHSSHATYGRRRQSLASLRHGSFLPSTTACCTRATAQAGDGSP